MPVPKRKTSKARRDKRSAGKSVDRNLPGTTCQTCQEPGEPHSVCKNCGYYKGAKILRTKMERAGSRQVARKAQRNSILQSQGQAAEKPSEG